MQIHKVSLWTKQWLEVRGFSHSFFETTTSTNNIAKQKAFQAQFKNHIFLAQQQTQGKGQNNRVWENSDLMITWLWETVEVPLPTHLSKDLALDLLKAVQKIWNALPWQIKPPNDLYLNHKKVAGFLLDILDQDPKKAFILGLGFNVFSHPDLSHTTQAGHLTEYVEVSKTQWLNFLNNIHHLWIETRKNTSTY